MSAMNDVKMPLCRDSLRDDSPIQLKEDNLG